MVCASAGAWTPREVDVASHQFSYGGRALHSPLSTSAEGRPSTAWLKITPMMAKLRATLRAKNRLGSSRTGTGYPPK